MMDGSLLVVPGKLLAVLAPVAANGFLVAAGFSPVGVRRSRVDELVASGQPKAELLSRSVDNLDANLAATQLGLGWMGEPALARLIEPAPGGL